MAKERFHGLTKAQENALALIAIGQPTQASPRTLQALKDAGLVTERQRAIGADRFGTITVPAYEMPTWAHLAWCSYCAERYPDV